ncbi:amidohydrolase [Fusibacter bizertensis]
MSIKELVHAHKDYAIQIRREFHMNPEPSMKEYRTSDRIMEELNVMGIECRKAAGTGVIGIIKGNGAGKTIALRADIDALDLQETNEVTYKSLNDGFMHGCGHDGHAAGLLTAAKVLKEVSDSFKGQVKLIFQPGEETAKGAKKLIEEGELKDVDGIFGIHLWNDAPVGKISIEAGPRMASAGIFKVYITGKGGHGSMPHQGVDAIMVGAAIVNSLQSLVSREISPLDPAVLTIGIFNAGTRFNVLAGEAYLEGTTRCFSMEVNDAFEGMMRRVIDNTAAAYRATAILDYEQLVVPTINAPEMSAIGERAVESLMGKEALFTYEKTTGGEDFSYYLKEVPGAFAFVGTKNVDKIPNFPHHHPKFDIDEDALEVAAGLYAQYAITYLNE